MSLTGLIYAAIAVAWLAYLIPTYARRRDQQTRAQVDPRKRFSDSVRIVQSGTAPVLDQDLAPIKKVEISTPMTRRSAVAELRRVELLAAGRRRRVLLILMAVVTLVLGACLAKMIVWPWLIVPGGLLFGFAVVARLSVRAMRRGLDARFGAICNGSDEETVFLKRSDLGAAKIGGLAKDAASTEGAEPVVAPVSASGGLWDPLPITLPTYVPKPLAPRTVRTIDLSSPDVSSAARHDVPVTADGPEIKAVPAIAESAATPRTAIDTSGDVEDGELDLATGS